MTRMDGDITEEDSKDLDLLETIHFNFQFSSRPCKIPTVRESVKPVTNEPYSNSVLELR